MAVAVCISAENIASLMDENRNESLKKRQEYSADRSALLRGREDDGIDHARDRIPHFGHFCWRGRALVGGSGMRKRIAAAARRAVCPSRRIDGRFGSIAKG